MDIYAFRKPTTVLQYSLSRKQHIYSYYIVPTSLSLIIYILNIAADIVLSYQHYRAEDPFYGAFTIFLMFIPAITSFFFTVTNLNLWPDEENFGVRSLKWLTLRFCQHLFFPVWAMFRFAEQLFWRIEAMRCEDETEREELLTKGCRRSAFNLYYFLQAYFHSAPQILFQMHIILRHPSDFNKETVDMQVMSLMLSLMKMSMTTAAYQRFKTQKLAGREYSWDKIKEKQRKQRILNKTLASLNETEPSPQVSRRNSGLSQTSSQFNENEKQRKEKEIFVPLRIDTVRGLTNDDAGGRVVAILWWLCFILPRMLILSVFAYFFPLEAIYTSIAQYFIVLLILLKYTNIKDDETTMVDGEDRKWYSKCESISNITLQKIAFYLILSFIYLFCLIEFKVKFTKVKVVYNWYFILIYLENMVMMYMWYFYIEHDNVYWYNYMFYLIVASSILSVLSMALYLSTLRPEKVTVKRTYRLSQL